MIGCGEEAPNVLKLAVYAFGLVRYRRNSVIPDSVKSVRIQQSRCITKEDYPDGELAGGQVIAAKDGEKE